MRQKSHNILSFILLYYTNPRKIGPMYCLPNKMFLPQKQFVEMRSHVGLHWALFVMSFVKLQNW